MISGYKELVRTCTAWIYPLLERSDVPDDIQREQMGTSWCDIRPWPSTERCRESEVASATAWQVLASLPYFFRFIRDMRSLSFISVSSASMIACKIASFFWQQFESHSYSHFAHFDILWKSLSGSASFFSFNKMISSSAYLVMWFVEPIGLKSIMQIINKVGWWQITLDNWAVND